MSNRCIELIFDSCYANTTFSLHVREYSGALTYIYVTYFTCCELLEGKLTNVLFIRGISGLYQWTDHSQVKQKSTVFKFPVDNSHYVDKSMTHPHVSSQILFSSLREINNKGQVLRSAAVQSEEKELIFSSFNNSTASSTCCQTCLMC